MLAIVYSFLSISTSPFSLLFWNIFSLFAMSHAANESSRQKSTKLHIKGQKIKQIKTLPMRAVKIPTSFSPCLYAARYTCSI